MAWKNKETLAAPFDPFDRVALILVNLTKPRNEGQRLMMVTWLAWFSGREPWNLYYPKCPGLGEHAGCLSLADRWVSRFNPMEPDTRR